MVPFAHDKADPTVFIGAAPAFRQLVRMIDRVAPTDHALLIFGPTGSGKELVARCAPAARRHVRRFSPLLLGAAFFGSGGGGTIESARHLAKPIPISSNVRARNLHSDRFMIRVRVGRTELHPPCCPNGRKRHIATGKRSIGRNRPILGKPMDGIVRYQDEKVAMMQQPWALTT